MVREFGISFDSGISRQSLGSTLIAQTPNPAIQDLGDTTAAWSVWAQGVVLFFFGLFLLVVLGSAIVRKL